jgi:hypothetical protein
MMALLSQKASVTYTQMLRLNYQIEQEELAENAKQKNDWDRAIFHYRNVVELISRPANKTASPDQAPWALQFPFTALIVREISDRSDTTGRGQQMLEGLNRGKLAISLERAGKSREAEQQYSLAMKLIGTNDIEKVKRLANIPTAAK